MNEIEQQTIEETFAVTRRGELDQYPVFRAELRGETLRFWCPYCRKHHAHGASYGHRVAHCLPGSPYEHTGYVLIGADAAVPPRALPRGA